MIELRNVLNFRTKEITLDEISLPMRDINKLETLGQIEKSWTVNNSKYQDRSKELQSTLIATKRLMQILDVKYEKTNLRAIIEHDCMHLSDSDQSSLLEPLQDFVELIDGTLGDWGCKLVFLELKEGGQTYHVRTFPIPKRHLEIPKKKSKDYLTWDYYNGKLTQNGLFLHL